MKSYVHRRKTGRKGTRTLPKQTLILIGPGGIAKADFNALENYALGIADAADFEVRFEISKDDQSFCEAVSSLAPQFDACIISPGSNAGKGGPVWSNQGRYAVTQYCETSNPLIEVHPNNILQHRPNSDGPLHVPGAKIGLIAGFAATGFQYALDAVCSTENLQGPHKSAVSIEVLNGPNLNLLGTREPAIYGYDTLDDVMRRCETLSKDLNINSIFRQSNHEGEIVEWIHNAIGSVDGLIVNAGAYTHTSIAIHDALKAFDGRVLELHISNPHVRESFRHRSFVAKAADCVMTGLGVSGYEIGLRALSNALSPSI